MRKVIFLLPIFLFFGSRVLDADEFVYLEAYFSSSGQKVIKEVDVGQNSEESVLITEPDNIAPGKIINFAALSGDNEVRLSWVNPLESDFAGVRLLRTTENNSLFMIYEGMGSLWTDTAVINGVNYIYYGYAFDTAGNKSETVSVSLTPRDQGAPGQVSDLACKKGSLEAEVILTWTAAGDDGYAGRAVKYDLRYWEGGDWDSAIKVTTANPGISGSLEGLSIRGLAIGKTYYFALKAIDEVGNESGLSNVVSIVPGYDTTAPFDVKDVKILAEENRLTLNWVNPNNEDFAGIKISRQSSVNGLQSLLTTNDQQLTIYIDADVITGTTYTYKIQAYDSSGNYSGGAGISGIPGDYMPPQSVSNLKALGENNTVTLTWENPADQDFQDIRIIRGKENLDDLAGYWSMDEGIGNKIYDTFGNCDIGGVYGALWDSGKIGGALRFDGVDDYVIIPNSPDLILSTTGTIEAWVKPENYGGVIAAKGGGHDWNDSGYGLWMNPYYGKFVFSWSAQYHNNPVCGENYHGGWSHVVGVADGAKLHLYVNGVEEGSISGAVNVSGLINNLMIGRKEDGGGIFKGVIDEVKIYKRALSWKEVLAAYSGVKKWDAAGTTEVFTDTGLFKNGTYSYFLSAYDEVPNFSEEREIEVTVKDTIVPNIVTNFKGDVDRYGRKVTLSWTNPTDCDFSGVQLSRLTFNDSRLTIYEGKGTSFMDTGLVDETEYTYSIQAFDEGLNYSSTQFLQINIGDVTPPIPVTNLNVVKNLDGYIKFNWTNPGDSDLAGVKINKERSDTTGSTLVYNGTGMNFSDYNVKKGINYTYTLSSYDDSLNYSSGVELLITPQGGFLDVSNLKLTGGDQKAALEWKNHAAAGGQNNDNLSSVRIIRSTEPKFTPDSEAKVYEGLDSAFIDTGLINGMTYYYSFFSSDTSNTWYGPVIVKAMPYDTTAPGEITNLNVSATADGPDVDSKVELRWTNPNDQDLSGIKITRLFDSTYETVFDGFAEYFIDNEVYGGLSYRYNLYTYDDEIIPNYSNGVSVLLNIPDTTSPEPVANLTAASGDEQTIKLDWENSADKDLAGIKILREVYNTGGLVNYFSMDETAAIDGAVIGDPVTANNGIFHTNEGFINKSVSGKLNGAISFDGTDDYARTTNNLGISGAQPRTVSLWFKPGNKQGRQDLFSFGNAGNGLYFDLLYDYQDEGLYFSGYGYDKAGPVNSIIRDTWNFAAVTYDGFTVKVYLNGNTTPNITYPIVINTSNAVLDIGRSGKQGTGYFKGLIDELKIYNRALTSKEILGETGSGEVFYINDTTFTDTGLVSDVAYSYSLSGFDYVPNYSNSVSVSARGKDIIPPSEVTNFNANGADKKVFLSWINPGEPDFVGARIIRVNALTRESVNVFDTSTLERLNA